MEVRRLGGGKLLYSGTLERGQRKPFEGAAPPARARRAGERRRARERESRRAARRARRSSSAPTEDRPGYVLSRPRAAIVVTGSELVRGERQDRNGPFLAAEAVRLGLDPARIAIVGDRPEDLERAFREGFEADLCLVSGGLGPTHDDRTVELVARVAGRALVARRGARAADRDDLAHDRRAAGPPVRRLRDRACASRRRCPEGAISLGLAGTAPGVVLDTAVLRRRRAARPAAGAAAAVAARARDRARSPRARARTAARAPRASLLRHARVRRRGGARRRRRRRRRRRGRRSARASSRSTSTSSSSPVPPSGGAEVATCFAARARVAYLFGEDERSIAEIVLDLCRARGLTLATAESCTGGMVAARLTAVPGSSDVFLGGGRRLRERGEGDGARRCRRRRSSEHGAVSAEAAAAMARGRPRPARGGRRRRGHRCRRAGRRHARQACRPRLRACRSARTARRRCAPSFPAIGR